RCAQQVCVLPMFVTDVLGITSVRLGKALKGVCHPHRLLPLSVSFQNCSHEDARAAPPDSGFNQITGNALSKNIDDAILNILQARQADHSLRFRRPVSALSTVTEA